MQLLCWPWNHICVPADEICPEITFRMMKLATFLDYFCFVPFVEVRMKAKPKTPAVSAKCWPSV
jgi:hypothetical protein